MTSITTAGQYWGQGGDCFCHGWPEMSIRNFLFTSMWRAQWTSQHLSFLHQVIHLVHKPPVVYSSVLRPLLPKASLWTGSTPWSWVRGGCCHLPPSPQWAPHRVSTPESDCQSSLWGWVVLGHLTSAFPGPQVFQILTYFSSFKKN